MTYEPYPDIHTYLRSSAGIMTRAQSCATTLLVLFSILFHGVHAQVITPAARLSQIITLTSANADSLNGKLPSQWLGQRDLTNCDGQGTCELSTSISLELLLMSTSKLLVGEASAHVTLLMMGLLVVARCKYIAHRCSWLHLRAVII
jgi:hypothetical protein